MFILARLFYKYRFNLHFTYVYLRKRAHITEHSRTLLTICVVDIIIILLLFII